MVNFSSCETILTLHQPFQIQGALNKMYTAFDPIFWHSVHFYLKSLLDLERRAFQMKHSSPLLLLILAHKSSLRVTSKTWK